TAFPTLSVTVKDVNGDPVADGTPVDFTVQAAGNGASATLSNDGKATTTNGIASITTTANSIAGGPYTVTATSNGHTATFQLTNTGGAASTLTPDPTTPQTARITTAFPTLSVMVTDVGGLPVADGTQVSFTVKAADNGASVTFSNNGNVVTSGGKAAIIATANNIVGGPYFVTATSNGKTAQFQLTNTLGAVETLTPSPSTAQSAAINTAFPTLSVTVKDAGGNPIADGTPVDFTVVAAGNGAGAIFANDGKATTTSGIAAITATAN